MTNDPPNGQGDAQRVAPEELREQAVRLLESAAHPRLAPAATGFTAEDGETADRETFIGLGWAMLYLADALRLEPVQAGGCSSSSPSVLGNLAGARCALRAGHAGDHEDAHGLRWWLMADDIEGGGA